MNSKKEVRFSSKIEVRTKGDGKMLAGYASVFNSKSEDLGGFREQIAPGAFTKTLAAGADIRALINHSPTLILGRNKAGTLRLEETAIGLAFEIDMPNTTASRDLMESVNRGDVNACSFAMVCTSDVWSDASDASGYYALRTVTEAELSDVSVVTYPAYASTSVAMRSLMFPDGGIVIPRKGDTFSGVHSSQLSDEDFALYARLRLALMD